MAVLLGVVDVVDVSVSGSGRGRERKLHESSEKPSASGWPSVGLPSPRLPSLRTSPRLPHWTAHQRREMPAASEVQVR